MNSGDEKVLARAGCPLYYRVQGAPDAPLLVLTHGAGAEHSMFAPQVEALAEQYRILLWDMRGHGRSRPMGQPFTVARAVNDLLAILDEIGEKQAIFIGQSTGGYVGQALVFRHPERVCALVMVDCACITLPRSRWELALLKITPAILRAYPHSILLQQSVNASAVTTAARDYLWESMSALPKADFVTIMAGVTSSVHPEPEYQITHPLLLVHGDQDHLGTIKQDAVRWAARDPNCRYHVIPDAGHLANMDNPAAFNRLLLQFLKEI